MFFCKATQRVKPVVSIQPPHPLLTWLKNENFIEPSGSTRMVLVLRFSISLQIAFAIPITFTQNGTPSNRNSFGVVRRNIESGRPKMRFSSTLISRKLSYVSSSAICRMDWNGAGVGGWWAWEKDVILWLALINDRSWGVAIIYSREVFEVALWCVCVFCVVSLLLLTDTNRP